MAGIYISLPWFVAIPLVLLGTVWIYQDAKARAMETADMWTVGFFVAFFILPLIGGVLVLLFYLQKRNPRRNQPYAVPAE